MFYLKDETDGTARLVIEDAAGNAAAIFSSDPDPELKERKLELKPGINSVFWNMRYPGADSFEGMVLWGGGTGGPRAVPGEYTATLHIEPPSEQNKESDDQQGSAENASQSDQATKMDIADLGISAKVSDSITFEIVKDPRSAASLEDLQMQFEFLISVRDKLSETHNAITRLRNIKKQITGLTSRIKNNDDYSDLIKQAKEINSELTTIEKALYQTKLRSPQDPLNFPIRLNNRLAALVGVVASGDNRPTRQAIEVRKELTGLIDEQLEKLEKVIEKDVAKFNRAVHKAKVPAIIVEDAE